MTPYERGYAAGLKAAAQRTSDAIDDRLTLSELEAEILSLPIEGEATNSGEQECVMVPVEPTERILNAIAKQVNDCMMPKMIYQAMLAAAKEE